MIWPDTFVEQANLAVTISLVRKALGPRPDGGQYIETMTRRGYRFAAHVTEVSRAGSDAGFEAASVKYDTDPRANHAFEPSFPFRKSLPETRYARSGNVNIAYQVIGNGPIDLVFVMGRVSHLEYFWEEPSFARFLLRLASFSRLILFDKRGTGLSDPVPIDKLPTLEERMDDVRAVMNAVGSKRAVLVGVSEGGPLCSLFAATYPEKTSALVMIGTYAKRIRDFDYPWAPTRAEREKFYGEIERHWGGPDGAGGTRAEHGGGPAVQELVGHLPAHGASPGAAMALTR